MNYHDALRRGASVSHFTVHKMIGEGGYGEIYDVIDERAGLHRAMKIEYLNAEKKVLEEEVTILKKLQGTLLFPQFIKSGHTRRFTYLVMELLGTSIGSVRSVLRYGKFSRYSYLHIA
jgi:predicted Ser/Thr protein kinase